MATLNSVEHVAGHEGITLTCPISCLGVQTVGDLLALLVEAGRKTNLEFDHVTVTGNALHEHERVTLDCPITCLNLSRHVFNALRGDWRKTETAGDLLRLLQTNELGEIRNIGPRRVGEVRTALIAAGFSASRYLALKS